MHRWIPLLLAISSAASARSAEQLSRLFSTNSAEAWQSIHAVRVRDGRELFALSPDRELVPASTVKVLTAVAALRTFGPTRQLRTRFAYTGRLGGGRLRGDLFLIGDGDPYLVTEELEAAARDLAFLGLTEVTGRLVVDGSLFGKVDRSMLEAVSTHAHDAPVSALTVNFNTAVLVAAPGNRPGQPLRLSWDPVPLPHLKVLSRATTGPVGSQPTLKVVRRAGARGEDTFTVSGQIPAGGGLRRAYRSVSAPLKMTGALVRGLLQRVGITVKRGTAVGAAPKGAKELIAVPSKAMSRIVWGLSRFSNNVLAETLSRRLACDQGGVCSRERGTAAIVKALGLNRPLALADGSGLSTRNRLRSRDLTEVLRQAAHDYQVFPELLASLPYAKAAGTLSERLAGSSLLRSGQVRAKTGTLTEPVSVSAIAGYIDHPKHGLVAFAVLQNGRKGRPQPSIAALRQSQDRGIAGMVKWL